MCMYMCNTHTHTHIHIHTHAHTRLFLSLSHFLSLSLSLSLSHTHTHTHTRARAHARTILDVRFFDPRGNLTYADVAVVSAGTLSPDTLRQRVAAPGRAAADMVTEKRRRYPPAQHPSAGLVPFVVESLERPAEETVLLLRAAAPQDRKVRAVALQRAWRSLS